MLTVNSSNGFIHVFVDTQMVISVDMLEGGDSSITRIEKFDLDEWKRYHKMPIPDNLDILDLGYWYRMDNGKLGYEPPVQDWRDMIVEMFK